MKNLQRRLTLGSVIALSVSAMIGSGIFVLPSLAAAISGSSLWLGYLIAGISVLPAALSKSELATAMPTSGGTYVYIERTFGPFAGTVSGIGLWASLLLKSSFALVGFGAYLSVFADWNLKVIAVFFLIAITIINIFGVSSLSKLTNLITAVVVLFISFLVGFGMIDIDPNYFVSTISNQDFSNILLTSGVVFVSYAGVTKVAAVAEEIKDPDKNLPRGIIISLILVTILYSYVGYVLTAHLPLESLEGNYHPIYTLANNLGGATFGIVYAFLGVFAMTSMANTGLMAGSRFPFAMSREKLLPEIFGKLHPKFLTPIYAIILSSLFMFTVIMFLELEKIVKLGSVFIIIIYIVENIAVIVLRETRVQWYKPTYRCHFYPWLQIFGIICYIGLLSLLGSKIIVAVGIAFVFGGLVFYLYGRKYANRKGVVEIYGRRSEITDSAFFLQNSEESFKFEDAAVVVALFGSERSPEVLLDMATGLSEGKKIEIVQLREIPQQSILNDISEENDLKIRSLRRRLNAMAFDKNLYIDFQPIISHDIYRTVYDITFRIHCKWLIKEWGGKKSGGVTIHNQMGWLEEHLACHVATIKDVGIRYFRKIIVLLEDKYNCETFLQTVASIAEMHNAHVDFVKILPNKSDQKFIKAEKAFMKEICSSYVTNCSCEVLLSDDLVKSVTELSVNYDLLMMTATEKLNWVSRWFGNYQDKLTQKVACSVLKIQIFKPN